MPHGINYNPLKSFNMFSQPPKALFKNIQKKKPNTSGTKKVQIPKYASESEGKGQYDQEAVLLLELQSAEILAYAQVELEVPKSNDFDSEQEPQAQRSQAKKATESNPCYKNTRMRVEEFIKSNISRNW